MPDSVVARIADRLDIQPEQTDRVLRTLAQLIKKQSARDGQVRVPGLGVFQQTTDTLTFEPDATLSEAVNHRFAGLAPVPVTQEPKPPEPTPEEATPETPASFFTPPLPVVQEELEEIAPASPPIEEEPSVEESATVEAVEEEVLKEAEAVVEQPVAPEEAAEEEAVAEDLLAEEEAVEEEAVEEKILEEEPVAEDVPALEQQVEEEAEEHEAERPSDASLLEEIDFNDPDISEAAAYAKLQEETKAAEEDAPSQWPPPGTLGSQADLDELLQGVGDEEPLAEEVDDEASVFAEEAQPSATTEEEEARPAAVALSDRSADLPPKPRFPRQVHTREEPRRRSVLPWILLVAAFIVIGSGLYFFFGPPSQTTTSDTPPTAAEQTPPLEATEPAPPAADTLEDASTDTTGEITTPVAPATPPQETPAETPSALRIDVSRGGYTLVVGSSTQQAIAEALAERFRQRFSGQSLPVDVLVGESDGVTRYRVVVGQVETSEEAVALKNRHAANLPEGTWPINISLITSGS